jgi:hypothetical protein
VKKSDLGEYEGNAREKKNIQENERRSKKMASPRSALSVNPTARKISIGKANKI